MLHPRAPRSRVVPPLLAVLLVVCLGYQSYRYPFQINSAQTSPTYQDTPLWLQLGKWVLIAAVVTALAVASLPRLRSTLRAAATGRRLALGLELVLLVLALTAAVRGAGSVEPKVMLLVVAVALVVTASPPIGKRASEVATAIVVVFAVLCVVAETVQVLLFLLVGRLPALAYANSPSVRFGSLLDDPNGFAVLLAALIPTTLMALRSRPNLRLVIVLALLCCLPLTQSWTGCMATPFAMALTWICLTGIERDWRRTGAVLLSALIVAGASLFFARSTIAELIRLKRGSVDDHAAAFTHLAPSKTPEVPTIVPSAAAATGTASPTPVAPPAEIPRGVSDATPSWVPSIESGYVNLYVNYGPAFLIGFVTLGLVAAFLLLRGPSGLPLALRAGGASYLIAYLIATANLALDRTFPCNVLYFLICGVAFASAIGRRTRPGVRAPSRASAVADDGAVPR